MTTSTARPVPSTPSARRPGLAAPPRSPIRAAIARRLFEGAVRALPVRVELPGGRALGLGAADPVLPDGTAAPVMRIVRPSAFFHRLGVDAKIGFGEAYMAGDWTADRLADLLTPFAARMSRLVPPRLQVLRHWVERRQPSSEENTIDGARSNIHRHYDLSNDLFATFLDETMTYSSALWDGDGGPAGLSVLGPDGAVADDGMAAFADAQRRKMDGVLDAAGVGPGTDVVEIGTGWGSLAIRAAERGARVTSLTISPEQRTLAEKRVAEAGVSDRVQVQLRDYRDAEGEHDAVVSVEMIEAVGERYWPVYFATLDRLLRPGGRVGLQAITIAHDRMLATRRSYTWIHKYVFPGGIIPSTTAIEQHVGATALRVDQRRDFGLDYATTLRLWRERFTAEWPRIAAFGFDETFRRMWEFYLAYCEAGFRSRYLGVSQFRLVKAR